MYTVNTPISIHPRLILAVSSVKFCQILVVALYFAGLIGLADKSEAATVCGTAAPTGWTETFCDDFNSLAVGKWNLYNGPQGGTRRISLFQTRYLSAMES